MAETTRYDQAARQLKLLSQALESGRLGPVRRLVNTLTPAEIGDLLESLPLEQRLIVWGLVDAEDDGEVLVHVGDEVRKSLIRDMDPEELVAAADTLDIDDLADLVEDLPGHLVDEVLKSMDRENRERLEQVLSYEEDTAGRLMNPDLVTVRADVTVDVVLRYLRMRGELPTNTNHVYVVSRRHQYLGRVPLATLVTADPDAPINRVMDTEVAPIRAETTSEDVAKHFADHDLISAPVVDENNVLLGRITVDDVVDVIREEAEETVKSLAGLSADEELFTPAARAMRRRAIWLGVNLLTAFVAASVIGQFEAALEEIVALAVLMPIVASMGGNAGLQAMTLTVRGLALGQLAGGNIRVLLSKELRVGLMNGALWAVVVASAAFLWFGNPLISAAIGGAMVINLFLAALAGVLVPVTLQRMKIDPAIAGSIVVTTVTDVMGFFSFLGLGTLLLLR
ncbi:MAG: magnesium transporter [Pseudomonadota bacterium]|jgi:magnesium transporter